MIDSDGYRPNVGIIVANDQGQVLWARRVGQDAWQFPQGGINSGESTKDALYRELHEEIPRRSVLTFVCSSVLVTIREKTDSVLGTKYLVAPE